MDRSEACPLCSECQKAHLKKKKIKSTAMSFSWNHDLVTQDYIQTLWRAVSIKTNFISIKLQLKLN